MESMPQNSRFFLLSRYKTRLHSPAPHHLNAAILPSSTQWTVSRSDVCLGDLSHKDLPDMRLSVLYSSGWLERRWPSERYWQTCLLETMLCAFSEYLIASFFPKIQSLPGALHSCLYWFHWWVLQACWSPKWIFIPAWPSRSTLSVILSTSTFAWNAELTGHFR